MERIISKDSVPQPYETGWQLPGNQLAKTLACPDWLGVLVAVKLLKPQSCSQSVHQACMTVALAVGECLRVAS